MKSSRQLSRRNSTRWLRAFLWGSATVFSALLLAAGLGKPGPAWVAWVGLIPLLAAARLLPSHLAGLAGATWGIGLYFYSTALVGPTSPIVPGLSTLALLTIVPSAYAVLAALVTRALGFAPLMLALLWLLAETALRPLGLRGGLLVGAPGDGHGVPAIAGIFGYLFIAFAIGYANAWLFSILSRAQWALPPQRVFAALPNLQVRLFGFGHQFTHIPIYLQTRPRAPPR